MASSTVNLDIAKRLNIIARRGDTFVIEVTFTDENGDAMDLTTFSWKMDVKTDDRNGTVIIEDSDFSYASTPLGVLTITATASVMDLIEPGQYLYDLQSTNSGVVKTWLYGAFIVNGDITT